MKKSTRNLLIASGITAVAAAGAVLATGRLLVNAAVRRDGIKIKVPRKLQSMVSGGLSEDPRVQEVNEAAERAKKLPTETVQIVSRDGLIKAQIADQGIGIAPEELPYIFEKFYKSKLTQNEKGTGLGLMIAKQIILRHGGDVEVQSVPGEGTTFTFTFMELTSLEEYE